MMKYLVCITVVVLACVSSELLPSCDRPVFCNSKLLHHVQMARLYNDSKSFVDSVLLYSENETLSAFDDLLNSSNNDPSREQIQEFVSNYFNTAHVLDDWTPSDYSENPEFLNTISDPDLRQYAKDINAIWPTLGRKVSQDIIDNPERYSLIPVTHGFIVPGGRFQELYYWDTYWVIKGLLISGMDETVKGMLLNFMELLDLLGHIPNGSRWYYQQRSQPPLLSAMVGLYVRQTGDMDFLREHISSLEKELIYWIENQSITFTTGGSSYYTLLRYYSPSAGPRPESYYEDYTAAQNFATEDRKQNFYTDIKSAAESGWDFSTRWFVTDNGTIGNMTDIHTSYIIPVDQNAMFVNAMLNLAKFHTVLGNWKSAVHWASLGHRWMHDLDSVLWNEEAGVWFDYNIKRKEHRKYFFASNVAPLWLGAVIENKLKKRGPRVVEYLKKTGVLDYPGGVPTSLFQSGEQWDFPNAWPPLVSIVVNALESADTEEGYQLAFEVAQTWIRGCHKGFKDTGFMFEKYSVETPGSTGGGGEYVGQTGFGWSNGVVLEFLVKYGHKLTAYDSSENNVDAAKRN